MSALLSIRPVRRLLLFSICIGLFSCGTPRDQNAPAIEFISVPAADRGGSDRLATIRGRVRGARPGQRVVLFARSGVWWVQPLTVRPFTTIERDSTWQNSTHLGTDYAALLVEASYRPPDTVESLPSVGDGVVAVATVKGTGDLQADPARTLTFSGYEWEVRDIPSNRGGANDYDAANAWVDDAGLLHLRLAQREGRWTSAEVFLTRALGYGTYVFTVRDVSTLDPAVALSMLTWDDRGADQNHRELDIEVSQWGDPQIPNGQYVLQPYYVPANVVRFSMPPGTLTHSFRWEPGLAAFRTVRGNTVTGGPVVAEHEFTAGVPTPGTERVRMNLYYFRYSPVPPQSDAEVVIERFQYLP